MADFRIQRMESFLTEEISSMIMKRVIKDPRLSTMVSISRIKVSRDLSHASVFISSFLEHKELDASVEALNSASGFIQKTLGRKMRTRVTPRLVFRADHSIEEGFYVNKTIEDLNS